MQAALRHAAGVAAVGVRSVHFTAAPQHYCVRGVARANERLIARGINPAEQPTVVRRLTEWPTDENDRGE